MSHSVHSQAQVRTHTRMFRIHASFNIMVFPKNVGGNGEHDHLSRILCPPRASASVTKSIIVRHQALRANSSSTCSTLQVCTAYSHVMNLQQMKSTELLSLWCRASQQSQRGPEGGGQGLYYEFIYVYKTATNMVFSRAHLN